MLLVVRRTRALVSSSGRPTEVQGGVGSHWIRARARRQHALSPWSPFSFLFCFCFSTAVVFVLVFRFLLLSGLVLFFYDAVSVCFFSVVLGAPVSVFLRPTGLTCFVLGDSLGLGARQRLGGGAAGQRARSARPASAPARGGAAARMSALNRQSQ